MNALNNLCDWNSRESVKVLEARFFWTGISFFFICAVTGIFAPVSLVFDLISGGSFVVGLIFEILSRQCDRRCEVLGEISAEEMSNSQYDEMQAMKKELDRRIDDVINPRDYNDYGD